MTIKYSGKIVNDFESYLERTNLWKRWEDKSSQWIYKLGDEVEKAARRSSEENNVLTESEMSWFIELSDLQKHYGEGYDLFGHYLEEKGMTSQANGQFFTPTHICGMMADLIGKEEGPYPVTISDCACGTGRLMIQDFVKRKSKQKEKFNPMNYIYYNVDIDYKSFLFTLLNGILRNIMMAVTHGDTMSLKEYKTFYTLPSNFGLSIWFDAEHENVHGSALRGIS